MFLNFDGYEKYSASLFFNKSQSYFSYRIEESTKNQLTNEDDDKNIISFKIVDSSRYFIQSNKILNSILQLEKGFQEEKFFLVTEAIPKIEWNITKETKQIGSYNCSKALGYFAGRNYIVWFTSELPNYFGPWKLHGLPGIILEAHDELNEVQFIVTKIENINQFVKSIDGIESYKTINREKYIKLLNQFMDDLGKKIGTKVGRNFKVKVKSPVYKSIEIYEN
jgi:GLPGLI family protein